MLKKNDYNTGATTRINKIFHFIAATWLFGFIITLGASTWPENPNITEHQHEVVRFTYDSNNIKGFNVTICYTDSSRVKLSGVHVDDELSETYFSQYEE